MLCRLRVRGFKSLADADVQFDRMNVIMGPNASGKSNLLDAMKFLAGLVRGPSLREAFEMQRGDPIEAIRRSGAEDEGGWGEFEIEADIELTDSVVEKVERRIEELAGSVERRKKRVTEKLLRYRVVVSVNRDTGVLRLREERLWAFKKGWRGKRKRRPFIETVDGEIRLRREGQPAPPRRFKAADRSTMNFEPLHLPFYPHIIAFREELLGWKFYYFEPSAMRRPCGKVRTEEIKENGSGLAAFYWTLKRENTGNFHLAVRQARNLIPLLEALDVVETPDGRLLLRVRQSGAWFSARVMSEGTVRVLGLLAILHSPNPPTLIGFEEPENGVHPGRLLLLSETIRNAESFGFQFVVNTHSTLFASRFGNEHLRVCRMGKDGSTMFEPFQTVEALYRRNDIRKALEDAIMTGDFEGW